MGTLVGAILTVCIFGAICWLRRRAGRAIDQGFALKLIGMAAGVGSATVGGLYPLGYVLVSRALQGGTIATSLPAGVTEDAVLGMALVGGAVVTIGALYALYEHLKS